MPKKLAKWGIKVWLLAESGSGFVWNFKLYTGKILYLLKWPFTSTTGKEKDGVSEQGLAYKVVMDLMSPLSMRGCHVHTNNYYTSPNLFADLKFAGFEPIGTVRKDQKWMSKEFQYAKLTKSKT